MLVRRAPTSVWTVALSMALLAVCLVASSHAGKAYMSGSTYVRYSRAQVDCVKMDAAEIAAFEARVLAKHRDVCTPSGERDHCIDRVAFLYQCEQLASAKRSGDLLVVLIMCLILVCFLIAVCQK